MKIRWKKFWLSLGLNWFELRSSNFEPGPENERMKLNVRERTVFCFVRSFSFPFVRSFSDKLICFSSEFRFRVSWNSWSFSHKFLLFSTPKFLKLFSWNIYLSIKINWSNLQINVGIYGNQIVSLLYSAYARYVLTNRSLFYFKLAKFCHCQVLLVSSTNSRTFQCKTHRRFLSDAVPYVITVSYTHLTLPTIYSV